MQLRRLLLGETQPVLVVVERPVRVDARLDAELGRAELDRVGDPLGELLLGVLVGVGRALALAEAAERAADDADVGDVDVAVDDERDRVARQLRAQPSAAGAAPRSPRAAARQNSAVSSSAVSGSPRGATLDRAPATSGRR
jgi:hypothetical protein